MSEQCMREHADHAPCGRKGVYSFLRQKRQIVISGIARTKEKRKHVFLDVNVAEGQRESDVERGVYWLGCYAFLSLVR